MRFIPLKVGRLPWPAGSLIDSQSWCIPEHFWSFFAFIKALIRVEIVHTRENKDFGPHRKNVRSSFVNILNPGHHYSCTINSHSYRCKMSVKEQSGSQQYSNNISMVTIFLNSCNHWGVEVHKQQDKNEFGSYLYPIQKLPARVNKKVTEWFLFLPFGWGQFTSFSPNTEFIIIFLEEKKSLFWLVCSKKQ